MNFSKLENAANTLVYQCVDVLVHGSKEDIVVLSKKLAGFRDLFNIIVDDFDNYVKKESEEKNA